MTTYLTRWEIPEAVDPPTRAGVRHALERLNRVTGMTIPGWVCLSAAVVCLALGVSFGWAEFVVVGVLAAVTVVLCLLFTLGRPKLGVWVQLTGHSVVVGDHAEGRLVVRNDARRRHWGSRLDLPVGRSSASFGLPLMRPGEAVASTFLLPTTRRGIVQVGPASSVQGDPFALTGRETRWTDALELYVHPRTVLLPGRQAGFVHDLEGHASGHLSASDMNFHALRPYAPGDDRRHVHWRSTARTGQLMVRQFDESRMSRVCVALDTWRGSYLDEDEFELAVSCAGSIALHTLYSESPLALLTSRERLLALSPERVLDELSLVEQGSRGGALDLVQGVVRREPSASVAVCITGSSSSMTVLRQACGHFDVDTRVIGLRIDGGSPLRARTVGNITVLQIGELRQLPRAMRKAME